MRVRRTLMRRLDPRDEQGVTILIVALCLVAFFGMMVLAVDVGALAVKHRGLVNANDAAALAAAQSFARDDAESAQDEADRLAHANVGDAEHDTSQPWWTVTSGLPGCPPGSCGSVKVGYQAGQSLFFGPAIGLSDQVTTRGTATAIWGPAGGGQPAPIMIRSSWLAEWGAGGQCDSQVPNADSGTVCGLWLSNLDDGGNPLWAWIDLRPCPGGNCGWNTDPGNSCPNNVRRSQLRDWIAGRNVSVVRLNQAPAPTYVCTTSGRPSRYFGDLLGQAGNYKTFPVSDGTGDFAPPGKVNIVGFTSLRIDDVLRGTNPDAYGNPGGTFTCQPALSHDFDTNPPDDEFNLDSQQTQCPLTQLHWPNDPSRAYPRIRPSDDNAPFDGGLAPDCDNVDYCYDSDTHVITWLRDQPENNARVDWDYFVPPSPGKCGIHQRNFRAVCLVVSWQGYRPGGINPGVGADFGLRAVRLSG